MAVTTRTQIMFLLLASGGLLLGALGFQYLGGLTPCPMCHVQRWTHIAVVVVAVLALIAFPGRWHGHVLLLIAAALVIAVGVAAYHAGVEYRWWAAPGGCSSVGSINASRMSAASLMDMIDNAPAARCDAVPWSMLGVSMAGWNAILSGGSALFALVCGFRAFGNAGQ